MTIEDITTKAFPFFSLNTGSELSMSSSSNTLIAIRPLSASLDKLCTIIMTLMYTLQLAGMIKAIDNKTNKITLHAGRRCDDHINRKKTSRTRKILIHRQASAYYKSRYDALHKLEMELFIHFCELVHHSIKIINSLIDRVT